MGFQVINRHKVRVSVLETNSGHMWMDLCKWISKFVPKTDARLIHVFHHWHRPRYGANPFGCVVGELTHPKEQLYGATAGPFESFKPPLNFPWHRNQHANLLTPTMTGQEGRGTRATEISKRPSAKLRYPFFVTTAFKQQIESQSILAYMFLWTCPTLASFWVIRGNILLAMAFASPVP